MRGQGGPQYQAGTVHLTAVEKTCVPSMWGYHDGYVGAYLSNRGKHAASSLATLTLCDLPSYVYSAWLWSVGD